MIKLKAAYSTLRPQPVPPAVQGVEWRGVIGRSPITRRCARIGDKVWKKLPQYADWGFAVFKLRKEATTVHPMAFSFPNAQPRQGLFFPTVHIYDGKVHAEEEFSHTLYCQTPSASHGPKGWKESEKLPAALGKWNDAGLLDRTGHVYRTSITGLQPNCDTYA